MRSDPPKGPKDSAASGEAVPTHERPVEPTRRTVVGALLSGLGVALLPACNLPEEANSTGGGASDVDTGGEDEPVGVAQAALSGTRSPAAILSLINRLDVYVTASDHHVYRATSFDGGNTWPQTWAIVTGDGIEMGSLSSAFGPAAAGSGDGRVTYLSGRSSSISNVFFLSSSQNYQRDWGSNWSFAPISNPQCGVPYAAGCNPLSPTFLGGGGFAQVGTGQYLSGPAIATSGNGQAIYLAGLGLNSTIYWSKSTNAGQSWAVNTVQIPNGSGFHSGPAIATSGDGQKVYVVAQGGDNKMYWTKTTDASTWAPSWNVISTGVFPANSTPAVATSSDGSVIYVVAQGNDQKMYCAVSVNGGVTWTNWAAVPDGSFPLGVGPAATTSWDGATLHVFAQGADGNVWRASGFLSGSSVVWAVHWATVGGPAPA